MKRFSIPIHAFAQAFVLALIVSACGTPQAAPTDSLNNRQSTAIAAAVTVLAETQAAIPTATLPPPTATVTNTATLAPIPTVGPTLTPLPGEISFTPTPVENSVPADPCINTVLPDSLPGQTIKIRIDNPTKAAIMVSVNLQQSGPQSVCGYRSYALTAGQSLVISDLVEGCYTLWAWNPDPKNYFMVTNGSSCLNISRNWIFDVSTNSIKLRE
ncbi:MAG: hypothetical protein ABI986_03630 [Chloroflexota bacterium]